MTTFTLLSMNDNIGMMFSVSFSAQSQDVKRLIIYLDCFTFFTIAPMFLNGHEQVSFQFILTNK